MKTIHYILLSLLLSLSGCGNAAPDAESSAKSSKPQVKMVTNMGELIIELEAEKAPKTVENFLSYVNEGFYNGTIFHRIIDGFMIQGGGFTQEYVKKQTHAPIQNEADNMLRNKVGTIAMARTGDPHSATAQFFINVANNDSLDFRERTQRAWGYAVFGRVVKGMEVVKQIKAVPTGSGGPFRRDAPLKPVIIESVTLIKNSK
jgi:peptidyl-prolyl cis-trans isomerase B (cyclophilin B)